MPPLKLTLWLTHHTSRLPIVFHVHFVEVCVFYHLNLRDVCHGKKVLLVQQSESSQAQLIISCCQARRNRMKLPLWTMIMLRYIILDLFAQATVRSITCLLLTENKTRTFWTFSVCQFWLAIHTEKKEEMVPITVNSHTWMYKCV